MHDIEKRLIELEVKASFSEDTIEQLNLVIIRQQQQIDHLTRTLVHLCTQLPSAQGADGPRSLRDELPPHY